MTSQATANPAENGNHPIRSDDAIIADLEASSAGLRVRAEELKAELASIAPDLRRYDKAIAALKGEPLIKPAAKPAAKSKDPRSGTRVAPERVERVRAAVMDLAASRDEFTQVDIRGITGDSSGVSSLAFEQLRQEGVIRFARQRGNTKVFRLTPEALASLDER